MKKKQLQNLQLNKKVISDLNTQKVQGGLAPLSPKEGGPGSVGGPCTSIQIPCSFQDFCADEK